MKFAVVAAINIVAAPTANTINDIRINRGNK